MVSAVTDINDSAILDRAKELCARDGVAWDWLTATAEGVRVLNDSGSARMPDARPRWAHKRGDRGGNLAVREACYEEERQRAWPVASRPWRASR